uniref:Cystatin domain-containing protein n=1 Tax=Cyanoderma ruficeps TaxID=181631 RepID=A0A8C3NSP3_9PASS
MICILLAEASIPATQLAKGSAIVAKRMPAVVLLAVVLLLLAHDVQGKKPPSRLMKGLKRALHSCQIVQIISGKKQIMAGVKYIIKVEIAQTNKHAICNFILLTVPWQNHIDLLKNSCQDAE